MVRMEDEMATLRLKTLLTVKFAVSILPLLLVSTPTVSYADCVCRCIDGQMRAICSSSMSLPPLCPPTLCPMTPPSIAPLQSPRLPPLGTSECNQRQVLNPRTGQYEWRTVCQ